MRAPRCLKTPLVPLTLGAGSAALWRTYGHRHWAPAALAVCCPVGARSRLRLGTQSGRGLLVPSDPHTALLARRLQQQQVSARLCSKRSGLSARLDRALSIPERPVHRDPTAAVWPLLAIPTILWASRFHSQFLSCVLPTTNKNSLVGSSPLLSFHASHPLFFFFYDCAVPSLFVSQSLSLALFFFLCFSISLTLSQTLPTSPAALPPLLLSPAHLLRHPLPPIPDTGWAGECR